MNGAFPSGWTWGWFLILVLGCLAIFPLTFNALVQGQENGESSDEAPVVDDEDLPLSAQIASQQWEKVSREAVDAESVSPLYKRVALTFDDGPDGRYTVEILDILRREGVPATFFVVGHMVRGYPGIVKRMDEEGHVVANHSWSHPILTQMNEKKIKKELTATNRAVEQAIGKEMLLMRPPYGAIRGKEEIVKNGGWEIVMWDVDPMDWKREKTAQEIRFSVTGGVKPDSIVLLHSAGGDREATVRALPGIIRDLHRAGYRFVTVDEILGESPYKN
ncbi:polysaccharide deacetylase family protein [Desmospora activa]|uniref:Peptidoglycan/xylan/chitin deacetylase (PgdA/CDA1 family) n=1 Tax=Desmospora activa DSM 45169 TaxID=1121389 RepID=A0A2T4Z821_9BACL|nr:polysaccharide deacetylase family protein [Desmospora activa]PTM58037.1 peptidoglycan/xylan/chitin deacetylase (PgdA/CDA1 family) [Desmospora activa DSM 45169]